MAVYVDDMYKTRMGEYGRMKMSHMVADTHEELVDMARRIGMNPDWIQNRGRGRHREHFDVSKMMRDRAIRYGAKPITLRQLGQMIREWRAEDMGKEQGDGS